ncbi:MAG: prepilin-type N-terminal cleavage/methylation domain-containing protein, partial [Eubacterium sp.]
MAQTVHIYESVQEKQICFKKRRDNMQFINKLKKNQKGFTLVELIVVLVILAILAAFTIPAMLGFV